MPLKHHCRLRGFTLIELMVCLAVIAVLAVITMPVMELVVQRERERELRQALNEIRMALDAYKRAADEGRLSLAPPESGYPSRLEILVEGVNERHTGRKLYFLRRLPRDPFFSEERTAQMPPAASTWGVRSYASSADKPRSGDDVYDVYSLSARTGLNGVPYREW